MQQPTQIYKTDTELFRAAFRSSPRALVYEIKANDDLALAWLEFDQSCKTDEARARLLEAWPKFEEGWAQRHNAYLSAKAGITKNPEACEIELKSYIEAWRVKLQKVCEGMVIKGDIYYTMPAPVEYVTITGVIYDEAKHGANPKKKRTTKQR